MNEYNIPEAYAIRTRNSRGSQKKYCYNDIWFKIDSVGAESMAECIVSIILSCSTVANFVTYERCLINGMKGCASENFIGSEHSLLSFRRIYDSYYHENLYDKIQSISDVKERYNYLIWSINNITGIDVTDYIDVILALDMLCLNIDRHFDNLSVIYDGENSTCSLAPIFDNGQSLGANYNIFPPCIDYHKVIGESVTCTLAGSPEQQFLAVNENKLFIHYSDLYRRLETVPDCREKKIILYQLNRYESIFRLD